LNDLLPGHKDCIGWCQQTRGGRRRASAARTYLHPALKRPNLQLVAHALVHRIVFDGNRATGVEFSRGGPGGAVAAGTVERADARREVILSAGAIGSPHILQLSGVGDPAHLGNIGVSVVHALPGVGKNMQDHYTARVSYPVVGAQTANERSRGLPLAGEVLRWLVTGKGMLTYSPSIVAASVKVLEESATPDVQVTFAPGSFKGGQIGALDDKPGLSAGAWQMRPLSRGYVEARSNQPGDMPAINPRYLSEESDRRAIVGGLRFARRLFAAPALSKFVREEALPGAHLQRDDELLDYARRNGNTCYHASCTCMMGTHPMAVVDNELRVHGLDGLRVIDASVMPAVTSTNTNAPTIMIAEKGAALIRGTARQRMAA
jgi:choline dehydrogenase